MERRKVRNRGEALALLDELAASGLERIDFCQSRGIDGRSLHCWERNLARKRGGAVEPLRLLEVAAGPPRGGSYRVRLGDVLIEVDDDFQEQTLVRLLRAVIAC